MGFENINNLDPTNNSSEVLLFDHLAVPAVPEPASAVLLLGVAGDVAPTQTALKTLCPTIRKWSRLALRIQMRALKQQLSLEACSALMA